MLGVHFLVESTLGVPNLIKTRLQKIARPMVPFMLICDHNSCALGRVNYILKLSFYIEAQENQLLNRFLKHHN